MFAKVAETPKKKKWGVPLQAVHAQAGTPSLASNSPLKDQIPASTQWKVPLAPSLPGEHQTVPESWYSPMVQRAISTEAFDKDISPSLHFARKKMRQFSACSVTSNQQISNTESAGTRRGNPKNWRRIVNEAAFDKIQARIEAVDAARESVSRHTRTLVQGFGDGTVDISTDEMRLELGRLGAKEGEMKKDLVILRQGINKISGEWIDDTRFLVEQEMSDWAYIDLLLSRYKVLSQPRTPDTQDRFRTAVLRNYHSDHNKITEDKAWCCMSGKWRPSSAVATAHIVPHDLTDLNAKYLFGDELGQDGHLMSPRNGLPLWKVFKEHFDDAELGFVPVPNSTNIRIVVFGTTHDELAGYNGKQLQFLTDFRPAKRYLCFTFAAALLLWQRHQMSGWWRRYSSIMKNIWATPGKYLRRSTLYVMARRIGHLPEDEAVTFASGIASRGLSSLPPLPAPSRAGPDPEEHDPIVSDIYSGIKGPRDDPESDDGDDPWDSLVVSCGSLPPVLPSSGILSDDEDQDDQDSGWEKVE